jgi:DNA-binding CsgD family transcriptional regulator
MASTDVVDSLVDSIYDAAYDPDRWPAFLQRIAAALNSPTAGFLFYDSACLNSAVALFTGVPDDALAQYTEYYATRNEWMRKGGHKLRPGHVIHGEEMCEPSLLRRTEFYNDYLSPLGIGTCIGACVVADRTTLANISVNKSDVRGRPYGVDERNLVRELLPHLARASALHRQLAGQVRQRDLWRLVLDRIDLGMLVVDPFGKLLYANAAGSTLLKRRDGLLDVHGIIRAERARDTAGLQQLVHSMTLRRALGPTVLAVARSSLRRPLQVVVGVPPKEVAEWSQTSTAAAVLFVTDPEKEHGPSPALLEAAYGLTPAEAAVAVHIACGRSVAEIAVAGGTRPDTVRKQLKRVFRKTGTSNQLDLTAVLTSISSPLTP